MTVDGFDHEPHQVSSSVLVTILEFAVFMSQLSLTHHMTVCNVHTIPQHLLEGLCQECGSSDHHIEAMFRVWDLLMWMPEVKMEQIHNYLVKTRPILPVICVISDPDQPPSAFCHLKYCLPKIFE